MFKYDNTIIYDQEFHININNPNDKTLYPNHHIDKSIRILYKDTCKIRVLSNTYKYINSKGIYNYLNLKLNMKRIFPQYTVILLFNEEEYLSKNKYTWIKQILDENSFGKRTIIISVDNRFKENYTELYVENLKIYEKLLTNIEEMFSIRKKKLILLGECDGAFVCLNLLKSVIDRKLYLPDYLFLLYRST